MDFRSSEEQRAFVEIVSKVWYVTAMAALGELGVQTRVIATQSPAPQVQDRSPA
jgi:hypothetical protein